MKDFETLLGSMGNYPWYSDPGVAVAGEMKLHTDDFSVTELPLYEPCGEGDHTYFEIEKRNITTNSALVKIAEQLKIQPHDIGVAGQKDARAVTRQMMSVEHIPPSYIESLNIPGLRVVRVSRHRNKLKMGHLLGNRFSVRLRNTIAEQIREVRSLLHWLEKNGVPNYFGVQRFGSRGDTWLVGLALLAGDYRQALEIMLGMPTPSLEGESVTLARQLFSQGKLKEAADVWPRGFGSNAKLCRIFDQTRGDYKKTVLSVGKKMLTFYVSAYQSWLFNQVVAERIREGSMQTMRQGDIAWKHDKGVCFVVEDEPAESLRAMQAEISPTGPLFGKKMKWPTGAAGTLERQLLESHSLTVESFSRPGPFKSVGGRRPLRIFPRNCSVENGEDVNGAYMQLDFELPAGAYATVLLREICKRDFANES